MKHFRIPKTKKQVWKILRYFYVSLIDWIIIILYWRRSKCLHNITKWLKKSKRISWWNNKSISSAHLCLKYHLFNTDSKRRFQHFLQINLQRWRLHYSFNSVRFQHRRDLPSNVWFRLCVNKRDPLPQWGQLETNSRWR